jgi:hypothetical protein
MATTSTTRTRKAAALSAGDAVLFSDGGEALVIGVEDGEALLRCGTLHDNPFRLPVDQVSKAPEETERHTKFRREAVDRGELAA